MYTKGKQWLNIFCNEHVFDDNLANHDFNARLHFINEKKVVIYDKEKDEISFDKAQESPILRLMVNMASVFVDTYYIILMAADFICGKHIIMKQKALI